MASRVLVVFEGGQYKARTSSNETIDFVSVRVGVSQLEMKETTGAFDFTAHKLTDIADGSASTDAASVGQTVLRNGTNNMTGNLDLNNNKLVNVGTPTAGTDGANKTYVDAVAQGLDPKASVRVISTSNLTANYANGSSGVGATLTSTVNAAFPAVDSVTISVGDRILVAGQSTAFQNGVYALTDAGSGGTPWILTRATDADTCQPATNPKVTAGLYTFVTEGTTWADNGFVLTTDDPITLGTTGLVFAQFTGTGSITAGNGIKKSGNTLSITTNNSLTTATSDPTLIVKVDPAGAIVTNAGGIAAQVDGTSIDIAANAIEIKALGVTAAKLNSNVAGTGLRLNSGSNAIERDDTATFVNDNAGTISIRQVVYVKANGHVDLAQATVASLGAFHVGVVEDATILTTASGKIIVRPGDIISGFSSLTPSAIYYVDPSTPGAVTVTATSASGQTVYQVGRALTSTTLLYLPQFIIEIA